MAARSWAVESGAAIYQVDGGYSAAFRRTKRSGNWSGNGNLTAQLIPRISYWSTDINPLYLMYLENVGRSRPYMHVGFTDAEKGETYPETRILTR